MHNIEVWLAEKIIRSNIKIISICGAADLGKSYLARSVTTKIRGNHLDAIYLGLDSYLIPRKDRTANNLSGYDPLSHNLSSAKCDIKRLISGESINYYEYKHELGKRDEQPKSLRCSGPIIIEGLHAQHPSLMPLVDFSIFIMTSNEKLKEIRKVADIEKRMLTLEQAENHSEIELENYHKFVHHYKAKSNVCLYLEEKWQYRLI